MDEQGETTFTVTGPSVTIGLDHERPGYFCLVFGEMTYYVPAAEAYAMARYITAYMDAPPRIVNVGDAPDPSGHAQRILGDMRRKDLR